MSFSLIICKFGFSSKFSLLLTRFVYFVYFKNSFIGGKMVMLIFDSPWPFFLTYFLHHETNHKENMHSNLNSHIAKPYLNSNQHFFGTTNYTFSPLTIGWIYFHPYTFDCVSFVSQLTKSRKHLRIQLIWFWRVEGWNWHN